MRTRSAYPKRLQVYTLACCTWLSGAVVALCHAETRPVHKSASVHQQHHPTYNAVAAQKPVVASHQALKHTLVKPTAQTGDAETRLLDIYRLIGHYDTRTALERAERLVSDYPNILNIRRGKTGSGIWLHGTPPDQFSRPPQASDSCVVLANPDLERIIQTVAIRCTPVVIANQLTWVAQDNVRTRAAPFEARLSAWRQAKSRGDLVMLNTVYASDLPADVKTQDDWQSRLAREVAQVHGRELQIKDLSLLQWQDKEDTMVVTFGEVIAGQRTGATIRQYWSRRAGQWAIFYEGDI